MTDAQEVLQSKSLKTTKSNTKPNGISKAGQNIAKAGGQSRFPIGGQARHECFAALGEAVPS